MSLADTIAAIESADQSLQACLATLKPAMPYAVSSARPRLLDFSSVQAKVLDTAGAAIWRLAISAAQASTYSIDRMVSAAALYRMGTQFGLPPGFGYSQAPAAYGAQALADFQTFLSHSPATDTDCTGVTALVYDWLWPLHRGASTYQAPLVSRMNTRDNSTVGMWQWQGYNNKGGDGMCLALATQGDTATDYVADYWQNNWQSTKPSGPNGGAFWSWHWNALEQGDCGNNEGFGYYFECETNWLTKACWESATDSTFLKLGFFDRFPVWFLFQHEPGLKKYPGVSAWQFPWKISTGNYAQLWTPDRQFYHMLMASTGMSSFAGIARWILNQMGAGYGTVYNGINRVLIYGLLMGDPRVVPVSPQDWSAA